MNNPAVDSALLHGYQLRLPAFEGPFDVLLRLVERSQVAITDISLVTVASQFMDFVASLESQDPGLLAEFSSVGSRLIVLKSRSLLPSPAVVEEEPISNLARELIEYRAVKEMALRFAQLDQRGSGSFAVKVTALSDAPPTDLPPLATHRPSQLAHALRRKLIVTPVPALVVAARRIVSLREMAHRVLEVLHGGGPASFRAVAARCVDLHETRAAFLALLVLVRRHVIEVDQHKLFGEISFRAAGAVLPQDLYLESIKFDEKVSMSGTVAD